MIYVPLPDGRRLHIERDSDAIEPSRDPYLSSEVRDEMQASWEKGHVYRVSLERRDGNTWHEVDSLSECYLDGGYTAVDVYRHYFEGK